MKLMTRIIAVLLAVLMLFSGSMSVCAADGEQPSAPSPADNAVDTSIYVKTALENPKVKIRNAAKLLAAANTFADPGAKLAEALSRDILTGQNVVAAIDGMADAITKAMEEDPSLASIAIFIKYLFGSEVLITGLQQDERFSGAVEKLRKAIEDGYTTMSDVADSGIVFESADFGFADGDAYGFIDALVCALSEMLTVLSVRSILGDFTDSTAAGVYAAGNYDLFVPLYELLELDPISSVDFTKQVTEAESAAAGNAKARFRAAANLTFKPVADLLTKVEDGDLDAVIDLLPRLLYALDSGMVNDLIRNLLRDKNLYGFFQFNDLLTDLDLSSDLLWNAIDKNLVTGTEESPAGFDFDKDGKNETALPMTKEQFDAIAEKLTFAADPVVKASVSAAQKNRLALETDGALVRAILLNAAVDLIETEDGAAFAEKAVGALEKKTDRWFVGGFVSMFQSKAGRFILRNTQDLLAFAAPVAARIVVRIRERRANA